jgi:glycosyltransferase involved in cell wall biosynthesis
MGNNPYHFYIYPFLVRYPGITVLHDYVLHHFIGGMTWIAGDAQGFADELEYNYGSLGKQLFGRIKRGVYTDLEKFIFPLNKRIIDCSLGIIVHNHYVRKEIEKDHPNTPIKQINMGIPETNLELVNTEAFKKEVGIPSDHFVIGIFGFVTPIKNVDLAVKAFHLLRQKIPQVTMLIVGEVQDNRVEKLVADLDLSRNVRICGFVPEKDFHHYIHATNVAINLRYPTAGETSASLLRIMSMGVPVIVFNYRQFAEIPDDCCIKIDLGDNEVTELYHALHSLAVDSSLRHTIGEQAKQYIKKTCSLENAAKEYYEFMRKFAPKGKIISGIMNDVAVLLAEIGINHRDADAFSDFMKVKQELISMT